MKKFYLYLLLTLSSAVPAQVWSQCTATITATQIPCNGGTGSATANPAGGQAPYSFLWSNGKTTQSVTGLAAGTYTVNIQDSQCTASGLELVSNGDFSGGNTGFSSGYGYCNSGQCLVPEGVYAIGPNPASFNNTWVGTDHTTGTGNFMIVNGASSPGASVWCQTIPVTPGKNYLFSTWVSSMNSGSPALLQFSTNGIPLGVIFSAPPSTNIWQQFFSAWYSGSNTSVTICIVNQNTTASGNDFGLDDISFQECTYCTSSATVTITQSPVLTATVSSTPVSCFAGSNGNASVSTSGGTTPYTYLWNNSQTTTTATGLSAGTYSLILTDVNGCTVTQSVAVTEPAALTTSVTFTNPNCSTGTGSAAVTAGGGTGPYTYAWSTTPVQTTQTASGLVSGTYSISVTDANGCSSLAPAVTITQPPPLALTASTTPTTCSANTGTGTVISSGGTPGYTYLWDAAAGGQTTQTASGLGTGTYAVVVTDANGCLQIQTVAISSNNTLSVTATSTQTGCTVVNGTATANALNGTAPYSYSWSNGQTGAVASSLNSGSYTITVTDANGCTAASSTNVTSVSGPSANATATLSSITLGENTQLNATGSGTYQWTPATGLSCTTCPNPTATPSITTEYCVSVTDANGCSDSACVTITVDIPCGTLYLPNAFSPNGDGENDELQVYVGRPDCIDSFELKIFTRWGEKIFETIDPTFKWNGIYDKSLVQYKEPAGTAVFTYHMKIDFSNGKTELYKGNVSLVR